MKCENCGHLVSEGYEYPEYYCELGIADNPQYEKYDTGEGCTVPKKKRVEICKTLEGLWWDELKDQKEVNR